MNFFLLKGKRTCNFIFDYTKTKQLILKMRIQFYHTSLCGHSKQSCLEIAGVFVLAGNFWSFGLNFRATGGKGDEEEDDDDGGFRV